ncbi:MAG: 4Fe-4S binding protein [Syntrophomonadaceae bacterium]|nr:4Fe-4S binding protein [Syntrophomonadaceae bacterium]
MNKQGLIKTAAEFVYNSEDNYISRQNAISEELVGLKIYERPIFAFGSPDDEYFKLFKDPSVIGEHFLLPREWLPEVKTVVSFFLPFSQAIRKSNRKEKAWPSAEWLHGRIEGHALLNKLSVYLQQELVKAGYKSRVPSLDARFWSKTELKDDSHPGVSFTSNWSERHVGFVCGLGTFGLSKGLITSKGMAGRIGSILTELYVPPDSRKYGDIMEYCSMCGTCVKRCPVNAISMEKGKEHAICSVFVDKTLEKYKPRYGCGKCQTGVPCESRIPTPKKVLPSS